MCTHIGNIWINMPIRATCGRSGAGRPLELQDVAFGIGEIERRAVAVGAIALDDLPNGATMLGEMAPDRLALEGLNAQAEMIHVGAARGARRRPLLASHLARAIENFDDRRPGAQLHD